MSLFLIRHTSFSMAPLVGFPMNLWGKELCNQSQGSWWELVGENHVNVSLIQLFFSMWNNQFESIKMNHTHHSLWHFSMWISQYESNTPFYVKLFDVSQSIWIKKPIRCEIFDVEGGAHTCYISTHFCTVLRKKNIGWNWTKYSQPWQVVQNLS